MDKKVLSYFIFCSLLTSVIITAVMVISNVALNLKLDRLMYQVQYNASATPTVAATASPTIQVFPTPSVSPKLKKESESPSPSPSSKD